MWCLSARRSLSHSRFMASRTAVWSVLFGLWLGSTASAQDPTQILQAIENTHNAIKSLDVRIAISDPKAQSSTSEVAHTREERFAFKGDNRLLERVDRSSEENAYKQILSILGDRGFQQTINGGRFQVFGERAKCQEGTFSCTTYGNVTGWEFHDPSIQSELMRTSLSALSLTSTLRHVQSTVKTADGLVTLKGAIEIKELPKALVATGSSALVAVAYEIVLDSNKAYAMVSRRSWAQGSEDEFLQIRNFDFQEVLPGVWLPTKGEYETGIKGKDPTKDVWKTITLQVNNVDDAVFKQESVPRNAHTNLDSGKRDPATGRLLAQQVAGNVDAFNRSAEKNQRFRTFLVFSISLLTSMAAVIIIRVYRRRSKRGLTQ